MHTPRHKCDYYAETAQKRLVLVHVPSRQRKMIEESMAPFRAGGLDLVYLFESRALWVIQELPHGNTNIGQVFMSAPAHLAQVA